jgi:hypothetical protein
MAAIEVMGLNLLSMQMFPVKSKCSQFLKLENVSGCTDLNLFFAKVIWRKFCRPLKAFRCKKLKLLCMQIRIGLDLLDIVAIYVQYNQIRKFLKDFCRD